MPIVPIRRGAPRALSALAILSISLAATAAQAQPVIYNWGPTPGYGYYPPAPVYRSIEPRYAPVPVYPGDDFEPRAARPLSGAQVRERLRARGLQVTGTLTRNGRVFVADVRDPRGNERRLIIDGFHGQVLQTFPATSARAPQRPGPRYAARPVMPDVDTDVMPVPGGGVATAPGDPMVIPGIGNEPARPRAAQPKKKAAPKVAARPRSAPVPAAIPSNPAPAASAPVAPAIQNALPQPVPATPEPIPPPAAALPQPAQAVEPQPAPAPVLAPPPREAAVTPVTPAQPVAPATPGSDAAPATGQSAPTVETPVAAPETVPTDRPRRRVRFIKPDSSTVADPNVPGGQLVPIPDAAPVDVAPKSAASNARPTTPAPDAPAPAAAPAQVAPLE